MRQIDGYVARILQPGEQILRQGRVHWIVYAGPVTLTIFSLAILAPLSSVIPFLQPAAIIAVAAGGIGVLLALLRQLTDELTVTTHRIIAKFGFVSRTTFELRHERIEGVQVYQSILGRLLDYGTVAVTGTGGLVAPVPTIASPLGFRQVLGQILHQRAGMRHAGFGAPVYPPPGYPQSAGTAPANQDYPRPGMARSNRRKSHWEGL